MVPLRPWVPVTPRPRSESSSGTGLAVLEVEDLGADVGVGVEAADEGPHPAPGQAFGDLAELVRGRRLEVHPGVAQALVLAQLGEAALSEGEGVLQRADDDVRAGELGAGLGRAAPEELFV